MRDWSVEGAAEREESYGRILVKLFDHFQAGIFYTLQPDFNNINLSLNADLALLMVAMLALWH